MKLSWAAKWAIRQILGTRRGNIWIGIMESTLGATVEAKLKEAGNDGGISISIDRSPEVSTDEKK